MRKSGTRACRHGRAAPSGCVWLAPQVIPAVREEDQARQSGGLCDERSIAMNPPRVAHQRAALDPEQLAEVAEEAAVCRDAISQGGHRGLKRSREIDRIRTRGCARGGMSRASSARRRTAMGETADERSLAHLQ